MTTVAESRIAWASLPAGELPPLCEAPRHGSAPSSAAWRLVLVEPGVEPEFASLCEECVTTIATDLGMTVEEGRARL